MDVDDIGGPGVGLGGGADVEEDGFGALASGLVGGGFVDEGAGELPEWVALGGGVGGVVGVALFEVEGSGAVGGAAGEGVAEGGGAGVADQGGVEGGGEGVGGEVDIAVEGGDGGWAGEAVYGGWAVEEGFGGGELETAYLEAGFGALVGDGVEGSAAVASFDADAACAVIEAAGQTGILAVCSQDVWACVSNVCLGEAGDKSGMR